VHETFRKHSIHREQKNGHKILVGKAEDKRRLGRRRPGYENAYKSSRTRDSLGLLVHESVVSSCLHANEPSGSIKEGKFLSSCY
jgi:hypothetical protein